MLENLITDRSLSDVDTVKTLAEAIKAGTATEEQARQYLDVNHKGAYTYRDMNRVEDAVYYVATRLHEYGYLRALLPIRQWTVADKPNLEDFERYFGNVATIRQAIAVWASTPEAPDSVVGFDVTKANALEQILVDVDQILNYMQDAWFFADDLYLGEV
jgi:hypothetical protein